MEISWGLGAVTAAIAGGLGYWIWRARRSGRDEDALAAYLIGDQIAGATGHSHPPDHHHHASGSDWGGVGGGGDAGPAV